MTVDAAIAELESRALVKVHGESTRVVETHTLVQTIFKLSQVSKHALQANEETISSVLARELAEAPNPMIRTELDHIVPHASALSRGNSPACLMLAAYLGQLHALKGAPELALDAFRRVYENSERCDRSERFRDFVLQGYAGQLLACGRAAEAEPMYARLLNRRRNTKGRSHPTALAALADYLRVLIADGKYEDVELFVQETIVATSLKARAARRRMATLRVLRAEALVGQERLAEAAWEFHWAAHALAEFTFEGHLERVRLLLKHADTLARMKRIDIGDFMPSAQSLAFRALQEIARTWGISHPLAVEAGDILARCHELKDDKEGAKRLRWALCAMADQQGVYNLKVQELRAKLASDPQPPLTAIADEIDIMKELMSLPSHDAIEEEITQKALVSGYDLVAALGRTNQMVGAAKSATRAGDTDLGIEILVETVKHLHRTQGLENPTYIVVLRGLESTTESGKHTGGMGRPRTLM